MRVKGIDVSGYQGRINWGEVAKSGVEFAILKVIRKDLRPDKYFEENHAGCTEAGVPVQGVYNYSYATTVEKAKVDAKRVLEVLNGRKPMVWLDIEAECQKGIGKVLIDIINEYGAIIRAAGLEFGVYTGLAFYNSYIKPYADKLQHPFWVARYPLGEEVMSIGRDPADNKRPNIAHELWGWQYGSNGVIGGIPRRVDLNELYVAVETGNVMPEPEATLHKVGENVTVSSYYASSTASIEKAVIKNASGTIMRIKASTHNPYCIGKGGVAIGWCNDGDIRSVENQEKDAEQEKPEVYVVKTGNTLTLIAKKYNTTVAKLQKMNGIKNPNRIYVGRRIRVR